jgi:5-methyltetrahydrofolate--homocysteine methyltransferase
METWKTLQEAILRGDATKVVEIAEDLLSQGAPPAEILNLGLVQGLEKVGDSFAAGDLFLPEVMMSARAVQQGIERLEPVLARAGVEPIGSVLIGTVKGDLHDIGKNIVAMMLRGAGFRVRDLGIDVAPERFVAEVREGAFQVVALSTLLVTSLPWTRKTIEALAEAGLRDRVKVLVGGAALDPRRAQEIGADGYAPDAARAVTVCRELIGAGRG